MSSSYKYPQNERALSRFHLALFVSLSYSQPNKGGAGSRRSMKLENIKSVVKTAESNRGALKTVDLGPWRPFSASECALLARLTGTSFAAEVTAAVSLVETPAYLWKATAVAKDVIGIKYSNKTSHSITMFLESRFASKDQKSIQKGTKAAVAMAFEVAAETEAAIWNKNRPSAYLPSSSLWAAAPSPRHLRRRASAAPGVCGAQIISTAISGFRGNSICRRPLKTVRLLASEVCAPC